MGIDRNEHSIDGADRQWIRHAQIPVAPAPGPTDDH